MNIHIQTLNSLKNLFFWKINFLKGTLNLILPYGNKLVESHNVATRSKVYNFVQSSWIIHCFYGKSSNVFFLHIYSCTT